MFERENEVLGRGWGSEQDALLYVVTRQHWKVRNREFEWFDGGFVVGMDEASRNYGGGRGRHFGDM